MVIDAIDAHVTDYASTGKSSTERVLNSVIPHPTINEGQLHRISSNIRSFLYGRESLEKVESVCGTFGIDGGQLRIAIQREVEFYFAPGQPGSYIDANISVLTSSGFRDEKIRESEGGNAGYWSWDDAGFVDCPCQAVGVYLTTDGEIKYYGVVSNVPHSARQEGKLRTSKLIFAGKGTNGKSPAGQIVRVVKDEDDTFISDFILKATVKEYNRVRANKNAVDYIDPSSDIGVWG